MVRASLLVALCALLVGGTAAQDTIADPMSAIMDQVRTSDLQGSTTFINDASTVSVPASVSADNGFGMGLPEARSEVEDYVAPQLVAPQADTLPQPVPQNEAAAGITSASPVVDEPARDSDVVAADAAPVPETAAAPAPSEEREATAAQPAPDAIPGADPVALHEQPTLAAFASSPSEARSGEEPIPQAEAAAAAPAETEAPVVTAAAVAAEAAASSPATETNTKATAFNAQATAVEEDGSGANIATFFALGAGCVLAVAAVVYTRKRRGADAKSPGTPKNELTFFHVQSRLTPPPV